MDRNLFEWAKEVGLKHIQDWCPDGYIEGSEWVALNPTRADEHHGSFKINLSSGVWNDFGDSSGEAKGADAISLYYYLNRSSIEVAASNQNYKNVFGGFMAEAAKAILLTYEPNYFPDSKDNFIPLKTKHDTKKDYWAGYKILEKGIENPPELDVSWYADKWGKVLKIWDFVSGKHIVMKIVRFKPETGKRKKNDRPFTLWSNGKEFKWRAKSLENLYPLYNVNELEEFPNKPVVLTEGQKKAAMLKDVISAEFVSVGWYGGAANTHLTNWETLRGREVWLPFDADIPGRTSIRNIKKISTEMDFILHPVHPPLNVVKGWNLDDAIEADWSKAEIIEYLKSNKGKAEPEEEIFLDDETAWKFNILGYAGDNIAFYPWGSKFVVKYKASSLNKGALLTLMDRDEWWNFYKKDEGGINWDTAINMILRKAEDLPIFDSTKIRKCGAWIDNGDLIINTGEYLISENQRIELYERNHKYIYERGKFLPYGTENPLAVSESDKVIKMLDLIPWGAKAHKYLLAGWILLAPFSGALSWRPNVWLQGKTGSGKSWILENITRPLIIDIYGVRGQGTSSPAGIRQNLENSTKPVELDEMESNNKHDAENIEQILKIFREGSSGNKFGSVTLHGTADGEGKQWTVRSMVLFASIGSSLKNSADRSRYTLIKIEQNNLDKDERKSNFEKLQELVSIITPLWAKAFNSRILNIFDELQKCIEIMINQASELLNNRRDGDQIGTLMAGAWMLSNDDAPTAAEARKFLEDLDIDIFQSEANDKGDEELVLDEILSHRIELNDGDKRNKITIGLCLNYWFAKNTVMVFGESDDLNFPCANASTIKHELSQYGIKPIISKGKPYLQIAVGHSAIVHILRETAYSNMYGEMLARLSFCNKVLKGPANFAGVPKRFRQLEAEAIFDQPPF